MENFAFASSNHICNDISREDRIKGTLVGGAIGDALGYPIEFLNEDEIKEKYSSKGIIDYELDPDSGKALISDDTQMSLFTANGLLVAATRGEKNVAASVARSYEDWLATQIRTYEDIHEPERRNPNSQFYHLDNSWLLDVPEMYASRAPGSTCVYSMIERVKTGSLDSYLGHPINTSKGCGGIMRVAPIALYTRNKAIEVIDMEAAEIAAITHNHPMGYIPAAMLADIIYRVVNSEEPKLLSDVVLESKQQINLLFADKEHIDELNAIVDLAMELSQNDAEDVENIHNIGEGWVAEETLGIALYCSLKYEKDFSKGIIAAVNHNGDSDSTGAVTGNILGAINGIGMIEQKWMDNIELYSILNEMAEDLCNADGVDIVKSEWQRKYIDMRLH